MRISSKTHYAMKTLVDLAAHRDDGVCRIADIARRQGIPAKFLEQILLGLKGGGIVASKRGIKGGYCLNRPPAEVTVADVMRLTGGHLSPPDTGAPPDSGNPGEAALQELWTELGNHMTAKLTSITLQDLEQKIEGLSRHEGMNYVI